MGQGFLTQSARGAGRYLSNVLDRSVNWLVDLFCPDCIQHTVRPELQARLFSNLEQKMLERHGHK
jgi:hypothetical protein